MLIARIEGFVLLGLAFLLVMDYARGRESKQLYLACMSVVLGVTSLADSLGAPPFPLVFPITMIGGAIGLWLLKGQQFQEWHKKRADSKKSDKEE
jgi:lipopolysaccharide export LptBFGC system permease protein LptF